MNTLVVTICHELLSLHQEDMNYVSQRGKKNEHQYSKSFFLENIWPLNSAQANQ